ncbi:MAG: uracil phosphoribosyltransferase [Actinomycetia bacterium]|nr:uracil phosphoribosyltransferase [Actinomycetes bacterium]
MSKGFEQLTVLDHPLITHKMSILRDAATGRKIFRELVREITQLEVYEATRTLPLQACAVTTPVAPMMTQCLAGPAPIIVPILRAGLGMVEGVTDLMPNCRIGHLGMYRDEDSFEPVPYYAKLPDGLENSPIFLLDPMLATGGSAIAAVSYIKEQGGHDVALMCIVAARPGVTALLQEHPDMRIFAASFDEELTPTAYITPGLGDAGDRLFGTL